MIAYASSTIKDVIDACNCIIYAEPKIYKFTLAALV